MNKNITVLDESGNEIGATYFKRARGLVKKGRARFVSETAIRLACPPDYNKEDRMQNNITEEAMGTAIDTAESSVSPVQIDTAESSVSPVQIDAAEGSVSPVSADAAENLSSCSVAQADIKADSVDRHTMAYCLEQVENIQRQANGMEDMFREFQRMLFEQAQLNHDGTLADTMTEAFRDMIKSREATNQQLLEFYSRMYDDLKEAQEKAPADPVKEKALLQEKLIDMCQQVAISNGYEADEISNMVNGILDGIRNL